MSSKLESQITKDQALKFIEAALVPSQHTCTDCGTDETVMVVNGVKQVIDFGFGGAVGIFELPWEMAQSMLNDELFIDAAWYTHELFGECLTITFQCPTHQDDPLDRHVIHLIGVRRS